ncbi:hypothetical protein Agub_g5609 [Astrephomene gubernaculifera]|uniref:S1 motif domain-containing protein n=1 Tax=Astrephomene gubernaculifera TaxID=47775 RepID=A0AAD3HK83_9CHLO|nr:hypothetical protein Agub_g5609 [Astrephomene gubernaculifera]
MSFGIPMSGLPCWSLGAWPSASKRGVPLHSSALPSRRLSRCLRHYLQAATSSSSGDPGPFSLDPRPLTRGWSDTEERSWRTSPRPQPRVAFNKPTPVTRGAHHEPPPHKEGQLVEGVVVRIEPYGVFVEESQQEGGSSSSGGGFRWLLHVKNMSSQYVFTAPDHFRLGDRVVAVAMKTPEDVQGGGRNHLSTKELEREPGEFLTDREGVYERAPETLAMRQQAAAAAQQQAADPQQSKPADLPDAVWERLKVGALVPGVVESVQPSGVVVRVYLPSFDLEGPRWKRRLTITNQRHSRAYDTGSGVMPGSAAAAADDLDTANKGGRNSSGQGSSADAVKLFGEAAAAAASLTGLLPTGAISRFRGVVPEALFKPGELVYAHVQEQQREAGRLRLTMRDLETIPGDIVLFKERIFEKHTYAEFMGLEAPLSPVEWDEVVAAKEAKEGKPRWLKVGRLAYGVVTDLTDTCAFLALPGSNHSQAVLHLRDLSYLVPAAVDPSDGESGPTVTAATGDSIESQDTPAATEEAAAAAAAAAAAPVHSMRNYLRIGDRMAGIVKSLPQHFSDDSNVVISTCDLEYLPGDMLRDPASVYIQASSRHDDFRSRANQLWEALGSELADRRRMDNLPSLAAMQHWLKAQQRNSNGVPVPAAALAGVPVVPEKLPHNDGSVTGISAAAAAAPLRAADESSAALVAAAEQACQRKGALWLETAAWVQEVSAEGLELQRTLCDEAGKLFEGNVASAAKEEAGQAAPGDEKERQQQRRRVGDRQEAKPVRPGLMDWTVVAVTPEGALMSNDLAYGYLHATKHICFVKKICYVVL